MSLKIASGDSANFVRPALSSHADENATRVCNPKMSPELLLYAGIKVPLLIAKPWGEETLVGLNGCIELWELLIQPGSSTSYHCHPKKDTLLIFVNGQARLRTASSEEVLRTGDFRLIKKKAYHQTSCIGNTPLVLHEIESPGDKNDLVRIEDRYQREGRDYLHKSMFIERDELTHLVLGERDKTVEHLKKQKERRTRENALPIRVTTHRGIIRELYSGTEVRCRYRDRNGRIVDAYEVFVPSLKSIKQAAQCLRDEYDRILIRYDEAVKQRSRGLLSGNSIAVRKNLYNEITVVLAGTMTFLHIEPNAGTQLMPGSDDHPLHELSLVLEAGRRCPWNLVTRNLHAGDIVISPSGCVTGVFNGRDAHYVTYCDHSTES